MRVFLTTSTNPPPRYMEANMVTLILVCLPWHPGHQKKIVSLEWHPAANNVLASVGYDHAVKVWDVSTQQSLLNIPTDDIPTCLNWSSNGSRLGITTKDKSALSIHARVIYLCSGRLPFSILAALKQRSPSPLTLYAVSVATC